MRDILFERVSVETEIEATLQKIQFSERAKFRKILEKYQWFFARSPADAGLNQFYSVSLTTKEGTNPVYAAQYKLDQSSKKDISALLRSLKENLILENAISNSNAPSKTDRILRMTEFHSAL